MLTKKGADAILQRLWETGGLSADMEEDINSLRAELDEREGMLRKFGEWPEGDEENFEYVPRETTTAGEGGEWQAKYDELRKRYVDRFFGRSVEDEQTETTSEERQEPEGESTENETYESLLRREDNAD